MTQHNAHFRSISEALADLFYDRDEAKHLALEAGLNLAYIDLSGAAVEFWPRILDEAERRGRVEALLELISMRYPGLPDLEDLRMEYQQWKETSKRSPEPIASTGASTAPQAPAAEWDVFISHAWEDKEEIARPLAQALEAKGLRVWFDEFTLSVGDRLRRSIDQGLARSRYGIVILSPNFFAKEWPQKELDGLVQRENKGEKVLLPVWHHIGAEEIASHSPSLADRLGVRSDVGLDRLVEQLLRGMRHTPARPDQLASADDRTLGISGLPPQVLTGSLRQTLVDAVLRLPVSDSFEGRSAFLLGLPASLNRNPTNARADLDTIFAQLDALGRLNSGQWPLLLVIENILPYAQGWGEVHGAINKVKKSLEEAYSDL